MKLSLPGLLVLIALPGLPVAAAPVTAERVAALRSPEQAAWHDYLARSAAGARADQEALRAEVASLGLPAATRAPDGGDFKLPENAAPDWFATEEAERLADAVLSYQTPAGGWSKHTGYGDGPRRPGMQWSSQSEPGTPFHYVATFDNRSTTEQIRFLAGVWLATGRADCEAAVLRGLDFVLAAQFPNGGWPQVYPLEGGYHDDITLNDSAMTHVLELLQAIEGGEPAFARVDDARRERASKAFDAGVGCVLKMQLGPEGKKTVWCAQYDALTLTPSSARKMEPVSLSGLESARVLKFLMSIRRPSPEVVAAIEAGLDWLEQARITTIAKRKIGPKTIYQTDAASTEAYWARFYDIETGRPIFPGRDGVIYESYAEMIAKNAGGYDYFTTVPGGILRNGCKQWRKLQAASQR